MSTNPGGLFLGPVRRPLKADSDFFVAGNTNRELLCKISVFSIISAGCDAMDLAEHEQSYECMFQGCPATFSSFQRHEAHYETSHRNRCSTCGRSFPTHRLLDLHLSEAHDSFFKAMAERRPMYACLVEGCSEIFGSSGKRHEHLVGAHRYPESFDFSRSSYSRKKSRTNMPKRGDGRRKDVEMGSTRLGATRDSESALTTPQVSEAAAAAPALTAPTVPTTSAAVRQSNDSPKSRRQRQLRPTPSRSRQGPRLMGFAAPPKTCKFWRTAAGCQAGSGCRFRHAAAATGAGDEGGGGAGGEALDPPRETLAEAIGVTASARRTGRDGVIGPGGRSGPWSDVSGFGAALVEAMEEEGEEEEDTSGGVDELISGMSMLLVPRHLRVGSSAQRGELIG